MPVVFGINNPQCEIPEVQSLASKFTLYQSIIAGLLSACTNPSLGALSDRYGRRKIIAFTALGMLLSELILIIAAIYPDMVHVNWILLGSVFEGLSGSFIAALALTNAYASDCTAPSRRSVALGYFHSILFGGIALGPVLAGYIVKGTGDILSVFWIALACHGIFFLFLMFIIPESVSYNRQMAAREKQQKQKDINSDDHRPRTWGATVKRTLKSWNIFAPLSTLWPTGAGTTSALRRNLALIAAVDFTMFGVTMGSMTVVVYYSEFMFHWDILATTKFISVVNTCRVTCLVVLLPLIARVLRGKKTGKPARQSGSDRVDLAVIRTAIFFDMLGYVGYATVRTGGLFILSGAIASIGGMGSPTLQSAVTKHVPPDKTGQVLGAMGLLHALARVLGPVVFNSIYATTVGKCPQTVFMCLAATFGVAFVLSWGIRPYGELHLSRFFNHSFQLDWQADKHMQCIGMKPNISHRIPAWTTKSSQREAFEYEHPVACILIIRGSRSFGIGWQQSIHERLGLPHSERGVFCPGGTLAHCRDV